MDWFSHYHAVMDYFAKIINLSMRCIPPVMWKRVISHELMGIISYVKAMRLILWGCESYLAYVCDAKIESLTLNSVPIVCEFPDLFPSNLSGLPPDHEIEFAIDL